MYKSSLTLTDINIMPTRYQVEAHGNTCPIKRRGRPIIPYWVYLHAGQSTWHKPRIADKTTPHFRERMCFAQSPQGCCCAEAIKVLVGNKSSYCAGFSI